MNLHSFFEKTSSDWIRYSKYEYKATAEKEYLTPTVDAEIEVYNPLNVAEDLLTDALNLGRLLCENEELAEEGKTEILAFTLKYGLLGYMTAIPLNGNFMEYPHVFFGRNAFFDVGFMETKDYIKKFQPFGVKTGQKNTGFSMPPALLTGKTLEYTLVFSRNYAEPVDWLYDFFKQFYTHYAACYAYNKTDNPALKYAYDETISSFREYGLGFQMKMEEKPVLVWDFNSLKMLMETVYGFVVLSDGEPLRICKHCGKVFYITHGRSLFCSERCRNQYNVYKHREKAKNEDSEQ